jgi:hypothetical protein
MGAAIERADAPSDPPANMIVSESTTNNRASPRADQASSFWIIAGLPHRALDHRRRDGRRRYSPARAARYGSRGTMPVIRKFQVQLLATV